MRERRFSTGVVDLNYAEGPPNGLPLVILHGGVGSWRYAAPLIELLIERCHVFALDLRGHGQSGHVPDRYRLRDYVADTAAFLAHVVREPAVVFGHSLGGEITVMLAAHHPDLVCAIIVGDAPLSTENHPAEERDHRAMNELWYRLAGRPVAEIAAALRDMPVRAPGTDASVRAADAFGDDSPWFEFQAANLHRLDPGTLAAVLEGPDAMLGGYEPEVLLPAITCPVLILRADPNVGSMLSDRDLERAQRLLACATFVHLEGIGHELHGTHPHQVREAISPFLDRV